MDISGLINLLHVEHVFKFTVDNIVLEEYMVIIFISSQFFSIVFFHRHNVKFPKFS